MAASIFRQSNTKSKKHQMSIRAQSEFNCSELYQIDPKLVCGQSWSFRTFRGSLLYKQKTALEPVCCKKRQKISSSWPVTGLRSRGPLKDLKDSELILNESKLFPWSSRISLVPFRTFRGPLFPKPVTCQELYLALVDILTGL